MEQQRSAAPVDRFWRSIAVVVVLLVASAIGMVAIDSIRTWRKEDAAAEREAAAHQQRITADRERVNAERQQEQQRAAAEAQRRERAELVKLETQKHPERMRAFAVGKTVRVLSSAPQEPLRGLACSVSTKTPVHDEICGVVWMLNYSLYVLPLLQTDGTLDFTAVWLSAEHLAAEGSPEEAEDLRRNPALARRATEQAQRIALADRRMSTVPSLREGDPVVISNTDPRPALHGRTGRVVAISSGQLIADQMKLEAATIYVLLDMALDDPSSSGLPVRVKICDLTSAPARSPRR